MVKKTKKKKRGKQKILVRFDKKKSAALAAAWYRKNAGMSWAQSMKAGWDYVRSIFG